MKKVSTWFIRYFFQGLLFIGPLGLTIYVLYMVYTFVDGLIPTLFNITLFPGAGLLLVLGIILSVGYFGSRFVSRYVVDAADGVISKIPFLSSLYGFFKDLFGAVVGDKKFDKPVLVKIQNAPPLYRVGFLTRKGLDQYKAPGMVAVFFPHSYTFFTGNLVFVPEESVVLIEKSSSDVMQFVLSAGISNKSSNAAELKKEDQIQS